ncbi:uncharacterized protein LOC108601605 [Drosophila busckii]|uniref:uncharacterized protein LOC108601605 n=1 Tax=Drosophila busckii TaxID=30019 RepID=UPI00083F0971|nr:uncharacterized protein LOC108601605 [Drosophila busckii]
MRLTCILLLVCGLGLAQAATWRQTQDYVNSDESASDNTSPSWSHRHSSMWPCDVADHPEAYVLIHKVEKRLQRIDNEQVKRIVVDYVVGQLRECKINNGMDEHCAKRAIGHAMSFISRQQRQAQLL